MFNYDTLVGGMSNNTIPPDASKFIATQGKAATLYVFSPTIIPEQVLRSYVYNFSPNLPDKLLEAKHMARNVMNAAQQGISSTSSEINMAILPSSNGIALDTGLLSTQWTFVLIIDTAPTYNNRVVLTSPNTRIIATGFCTEEPINPITKTINPGAVLMFTKTNLSYASSTLDQTGRHTTITNASDCDMASELNCQVAYNTDLFVGTPQDIRTAVAGSLTEQPIGAYGSMALTNAKSDVGTRTIPGQLKTPKVQFNKILSALDSAVDAATAVSDSIMGDVYGSTRLDNPVDMVLSTFNSNVIGSTNTQPQQGIDTTKPISMSELSYIFGGSIQVFPFQVPPLNSWETTPQDIMSPRNQMSAMLAASLSNLVPACGLTHIAFRYSSYSLAGPMSIDEFTSRWEILAYGTIVECSGRQLDGVINGFKHYFEVELTPILKLRNGAFDLFAHLDATGYILIDLIYKCDAGLRPHEGYYETSARLGGYLNPLICDLNTINNNALQLDALVTDIACKQIGPERYTRPLIAAGGGVPDDNVYLQQPGSMMGTADYSNLI